MIYSELFKKRSSKKHRNLIKGIHQNIEGILPSLPPGATHLKLLNDTSRISFNFLPNLIHNPWYENEGMENIASCRNMVSYNMVSYNMVSQHGIIQHGIIQHGIIQQPPAMETWIDLVSNRKLVTSWQLIDKFWVRARAYHLDDAWLTVCSQRTAGGNQPRPQISILMASSVRFIDNQRRLVPRLRDE